MMSLKVPKLPDQTTTLPPRYTPPSSFFPSSHLPPDCSPPPQALEGAPSEQLLQQSQIPQYYAAQPWVLKIQNKTNQKPNSGLFHSSDSVRLLTPSFIRGLLSSSCLHQCLLCSSCLCCRDKSCHFEPSSMWACQALHI